MIRPKHRIEQCMNRELAPYVVEGERNFDVDRRYFFQLFSRHLKLQHALQKLVVLDMKLSIKHEKHPSRALMKDEIARKIRNLEELLDEGLLNMQSCRRASEASNANDIFNDDGGFLSESLGSLAAETHEFSVRIEKELPTYLPQVATDLRSGSIKDYEVNMQLMAAEQLLEQLSLSKEKFPDILTLKNKSSATEFKRPEKVSADPKEDTRLADNKTRLGLHPYGEPTDTNTDLIIRRYGLLSPAFIKEKIRKADQPKNVSRRDVSPLMEGLVLDLRFQAKEVHSLLLLAKNTSMAGNARQLHLSSLRELLEFINYEVKSEMTKEQCNEAFRKLVVALLSTVNFTMHYLNSDNEFDKEITDPKRLEKVKTEFKEYSKFLSGVPEKFNENTETYFGNIKKMLVNIFDPEAIDNLFDIVQDRQQIKSKLDLSEDRMVKRMPFIKKALYMHALYFRTRFTWVKDVLWYAHPMYDVIKVEDAEYYGVPALFSYYSTYYFIYRFMVNNVEWSKIKDVVLKLGDHLSKSIAESWFKINEPVTADKPSQAGFFDYVSVSMTFVSGLVVAAGSSYFLVSYLFSKEEKYDTKIMSILRNVYHSLLWISSKHVEHPWVFHAYTWLGLWFVPEIIRQGDSPDLVEAIGTFLPTVVLPLTVFTAATAVRLMIKDSHGWNKIKGMFDYILSFVTTSHGEESTGYVFYSVVRTISDFFKFDSFMGLVQSAALWSTLNKGYLRRMLKMKDNELISWDNVSVPAKYAAAVFDPFHTFLELLDTKSENMMQFFRENSGLMAVSVISHGLFSRFLSIFRYMIELHGSVVAFTHSVVKVGEGNVVTLDSYEKTLDVSLTNVTDTEVEFSSVVQSFRAGNKTEFENIMKNIIGQCTGMKDESGRSAAHTYSLLSKIVEDISGSPSQNAIFKALKVKDEEELRIAVAFLFFTYPHELAGFMGSLASGNVDVTILPAGEKILSTMLRDLDRSFSYFISKIPSDFNQTLTSLSSAADAFQKLYICSLQKNFRLAIFKDYILTKDKAFSDKTIIDVAEFTNTIPKFSSFKLRVEEEASTALSVVPQSKSQVLMDYVATSFQYGADSISSLVGFAGIVVGEMNFSNFSSSSCYAGSSCAAAVTASMAATTVIMINNNSEHCHGSHKTHGRSGHCHGSHKTHGRSGHCHGSHKTKHSMAKYRHEPSRGMVFVQLSSIRKDTVMKLMDTDSILRKEYTTKDVFVTALAYFVQDMMLFLSSNEKQRYAARRMDFEYLNDAWYKVVRTIKPASEFKVISSDEIFQQIRDVTTAAADAIYEDFGDSDMPAPRRKRLGVTINVRGLDLWSDGLIDPMNYAPSGADKEAVYDAIKDSMVFLLHFVTSNMYLASIYKDKV